MCGRSCRSYLQPDWDAPGPRGSNHTWRQNDDKRSTRIANTASGNVCSLWLSQAGLILVAMRRVGELEGVVYRSCRIRLRVSAAQRRRGFALLRCGGDVWAALVGMNRERFRRGGPPIFDYRCLCRELTGSDVGELSVAAARSVLRRYSDACLTAAARKRAGERARYPRRKRALMPVRFYAGTFSLEGTRLRLSTAMGTPALVLRLSRDLPYRSETVRSVTLLVDAGVLAVDVTAEVEVDRTGVDPGRVAGVDLGIIHPYAAAGPGGDAMLISGRAVRAEERLHLADSKARARKMAAKAPRRGQRGSRRWKKLRAAQRRAESRHLRRVRHAHHHAAKELIAWAVAHRIGTLIVGHPKGIAGRDAGRHQNRRVANTWRRTHLSAALADKAAQAGITVRLVDERATSSTCPHCSCRAKPSGRRFACPACGYRGHRDLTAAINIAAKSGGTTADVSAVTHRRAGHPPARRDRRRHLMDRRRSCPAPGRPPPRRESLASSPRSPTAPAVTPAGTAHQHETRINQPHKRWLKGH
jgi:IS605 OrfB family transposase